MAIKIFAMNDCDWMAAETVEDATREYKEQFSGGEFDDGEPVELSDEDMERLTFCETDEDEEAVERISFREKLNRMIAEGEQFPCFFASTEF